MRIEKDFYELKVLANDGQMLNMAKFRGKKLMIVNTASACGYTPQYAALQEIYDELSALGFSVVAFPSNDFGHQEPGTDSEIKAFCEVGYGVTFPIMAKSDVLGDSSNSVYKWLADLGAVPEWNFAKFLIDDQGSFVKQLPASENPACEFVLNWLNNENK